jgi:hypothetical protein
MTMLCTLSSHVRPSLRVTPEPADPKPITPPKRIRRKKRHGTGADLRTLAKRLAKSGHRNERVHERLCCALYAAVDAAKESLESHDENGRCACEYCREIAGMLYILSRFSDFFDSNLLLFPEMADRCEERSRCRECSI